MCHKGDETTPEAHLIMPVYALDSSYIITSGILLTPVMMMATLPDSPANMCLDIEGKVETRLDVACRALIVDMYLLR